MTRVRERFQWRLMLSAALLAIFMSSQLNVAYAAGPDDDAVSVTVEIAPMPGATEPPAPTQAPTQTPAPTQAPAPGSECAEECDANELPTAGVDPRGLMLAAGAMLALGYVGFAVARRRAEAPQH